MNVLVTNDDGYGAWGIEALIKVLSKKHNVFVVAPDGNRSGNSTHINLNCDLTIKKVCDNHWITSGTPADCSSIGLRSDIFDCKIDAVVAGINKGQNIGTDVMYSGTCGAAKEAAFRGVPGIAVSMQLPEENQDWDDINNWHFDVLAEFVSNNLETLCSLCTVSDNGKMPKSKCTFVNINSYSYKTLKEPIFTDLCFRNYVDDKFEIREEQGQKIIKLVFGNGNSTSREYSDADAIKDGHISVSLVYVEPMCANNKTNLESIKFSL